MAKTKAAAAPATAPAPAVAVVTAQPASQDNGSGAGASEQSTLQDNAANATAASVLSEPAAAAPAQAPVVEPLPVADDDEDSKLSLADVVWPFKVRIQNHSAADLSCRVSGAYLPAAGSAITHFHDEAHAAAVAQSLAQLAAENFIDPKKLVIEPA